jgi:hypothetical protein
MRPPLPAFLLAALLTTPVWSQDAGQPLNLKLPPGDLPTPAGTASKPATAPGVYYGDHSGRTGAGDEAAAVPDCDDATYNQPQVHGSVGMGVVGGGHVDGDYQHGTVNISKAFGSCDHPSGGISVSIGAGSGHFHRDGH